VSGPVRKDGRSVTSAVIYARVSSARQKKAETIASQTAALRAHAQQLALDVPDEWVFEDEGHSGATLIRPALERMRDLIASIGIEVVLCYSPDRLARKFAYQALLLEEFARAGTRVEFIKGPRGDSPEDRLLVQFQGMFAEYEKAQIMERYRRGKAHRARTGSINVLSGAPFGYRYVRKNEHSAATYQIVEHEAVLVAELFRRYADEGASIADLARWLTVQGVPTRKGKHRWDRSVIWGMLRNPAYAGRAMFGKTMVVHESPGLNRIARLQGRSTPRACKTVDRPREECTDIPVPAIVSEDTFERVAARLTDNKRFASRNSTIPSLLQGLAACSACGYGYYRTSTRTTKKKIFYYRCLGSDDYRYEGGRVCANKPVRADYLDTVVWDHITGLIADPQLIRTEIDNRLAKARTADPATRERERLTAALAKASAGIANMIEAFGEQLISIDELRARMPDCAPAKPTCVTRSRRWTTNSPTARPTSPSPPTWKASSPRCTPTPRRPPSTSAAACCGCSSKTSSSDRKRSPSGTASRSDNTPAMTPTPTRRVNIAKCVGGVRMPPCGVPVAGSECGIFARPHRAGWRGWPRPAQRARRWSPARRRSDHASRGCRRSPTSRRHLRRWLPRSRESPGTHQRSRRPRSARARSPCARPPEL
jgi:site-specific DNA recombinase